MMLLRSYNPTIFTLLKAGGAVSILQEMKHSEGVTPIGGLVYMCQHVLWIILRYFSSSLKNKVKITKKQG